MSQIKVEKSEQDDEIYMSAAETNKLTAMSVSKPNS